MGRLATVGPDGRPHIVPLTYRYNPDEDTIDLGGIDFANTRSGVTPRPTAGPFLVDDFSPTAMRGGGAGRRRDPRDRRRGDQPPVPPVRAPVHPPPPRRVSWGLEEGTGLTEEGFRAASAAWAEHRGPAGHAALDRRSAGRARPGPRRGAGPGPRHGPSSPQWRQPPGLAGGRGARRGHTAPAAGPLPRRLVRLPWPSCWQA